MLFINLFNLCIQNYLVVDFDEEDGPVDSSIKITSCMEHISPVNLVLKNLCLISSLKFALSSGLNLRILQKKSLIIYFSIVDEMLL